MSNKILNIFGEMFFFLPDDDDGDDNNNNIQNSSPYLLKQYGKQIIAKSICKVLLVYSFLVSAAN